MIANARSTDDDLLVDAPIAEGWVWTRVFALGEFGTEAVKTGPFGAILKSKEFVPSGVPILAVGNVQSGWLDLENARVDHVTEAKAAELSDYRVCAGDVLFTRSGTIGRSTVVPRSAVGWLMSYHLLRVRADERLVNPQYLYFVFSGCEKSRRYTNESVIGTTRPGVNTQILKNMPVPLPPRIEQDRIVAKSEEFRSKIYSARDHLSRVPTILKRFRQAVLAAACSGRLTENWRGDHPNIERAAVLADRIRESHTKQAFGHGGQAATPTEDVHNVTLDELPDTWIVEELKFLCQPGRSITYGILKPGPDVLGGVPYIRVADFPNDRLKLQGIRRTSTQIADLYRRSALRGGDVLLSIRGTVGRVCRVPAQLDGANITQDTARISIHSEVSSDYIEAYLRCPSAQKRLEAAMKGVAVRGVNIGDVRVLQVALPPRLEQDEIVRRVDALLKIADAMEHRLVKAIASSDKLTQSILAKAFGGELVPTEAELARREGREYEPASVLLERIKKDRSTENSQPRLKRTPARRQRVKPVNTRSRV
jgi:type I restriction enzyme S subunit